jgi:hypothetical protein
MMMMSAVALMVVDFVMFGTGSPPAARLDRVGGNPYK